MQSLVMSPGAHYPSFAQVCHEGNWIHRIRQEVDASPRTSTLRHHAGDEIFDLNQLPKSSRSTSERGISK